MGRPAQGCLAGQLDGCGHTGWPAACCCPASQDLAAPVAVWFADLPQPACLPCSGGQQRANDPLAKQPDHRDTVALQQRGYRRQRRAGKPVQLPPAGATRAQQRQRQRRGNHPPARRGSWGSNIRGWPANSEHLSHSCDSRPSKQRGRPRQRPGRQLGRQQRLWRRPQGRFPQQLLQHSLWRSSSSAGQQCRQQRCPCRACRRCCRSRPGPGRRCLPGFWRSRLKRCPCGRGACQLNHSPEEQQGGS